MGKSFPCTFPLAGSFALSYDKVLFELTEEQKDWELKIGTRVQIVCSDIFQESTPPIGNLISITEAAPNDELKIADEAARAYDDIISWADMYDSASMESKKMIVSCLIRRVEVYRDYRLHIDFNIDFEQFSAGLDISAIAA